MPVHDWTREGNGIFHDFHYSWILEIKRALKPQLPRGYYVMAEQLGGNCDARDVYSRLQRSVVIRHTSDDRIVAMIEVLSAGNKSSRHAIRAFLDKAVAALDGGVHLLLIDVHPPGPRDPNGIHAALLKEISTEEYVLSPERPLTAAAYIGGAVVDAFVSHFAVGQEIPQMPVFLTRENYIHVPLEKTYMAAWNDVPLRYQETLCASE
jgi:hypothetical protein